MWAQLSTPSGVLSAACALLLSGLVVLMGVTQPVVNWDAIPYTGAALAESGKSDSDLHAETWAHLADAFPLEKLDSLTNSGAGPAFRADPANLAGILPIYQIKPLYIALLKLGSNPAITATWLSALSAAGLVLVLWLAGLGLPGAWKLAFMPAAVLVDVFWLARIATPDALATLIVSGAVLLLCTRRPLASSTALMLGVFVRPDVAIKALTLAPAMALRSRFIAAGMAVCAVLAGYVTSRPVADLTWWSQVHLALVQPNLPDPDATFDPSIYTWALGHALLAAPQSVAFLSCAVLVAGWRRALPSNRLGLWIAAGMALAALAQILLFPVNEIRLFAPVVAGIAVAALHQPTAS